MSVHLSIMRQLLIESKEINDRIDCGDICSAKTGLPVARKLCEHYAKILSSEKCEQVKIEPFIAYGGWIGITYSYDIDGFEVAGSQVPRRV